MYQFATKKIRDSKVEQNNLNELNGTLGKGVNRHDGRYVSKMKSVNRKYLDGRVIDLVVQLFSF